MSYDYKEIKDTNEDCDSFSEILKWQLDKYNLTTAELSEYTGINKYTLNQYVSGKLVPGEGRRYEIIRAIAKHVGLEDHI